VGQSCDGHHYVNRSLSPSTRVDTLRRVGATAAPQRRRPCRIVLSGIEKAIFCTQRDRLESGEYLPVWPAIRGLRLITSASFQRISIPQYANRQCIAFPPQKGIPARAATSEMGEKPSRAAQWSTAAAESTPPSDTERDLGGRADDRLATALGARSECGGIERHRARSEIVLGWQQRGEPPDRHQARCQAPSCLSGMRVGPTSRWRIALNS